VRPDHPQARAEIARAYFLMGDNKLARQEFQAVKGTKPPAEVSAALDRFLDAIDARERASRTGIAAYLEATVGHDDNANAATSTTSFAIPLFPGLTFNLAAAAAQRSDDFWSVAGGVNGRYAIDNELGLIGGASFDRRTNSTLDQFDTGSYGANGGVSLRRNADEYTLALQAQTFEVDNARFRDALGAVAQWRRTLSEKDQVSAYLQQTRLTYPGQTARNADRTVLGGAWAHVYSGVNASFAGAYFGREDELGSGSPQFGHDLWGARVGGQVGWTDKWVFSANLSYENRKYGGPDPLFLNHRHDREANVRLAAAYLIDSNWTLTPAFTYTKNRSNIVVNTYDRTQIMLTLRRDFR
jgi:hypothetical protein